MLQAGAAAVGQGPGTAFVCTGGHVGGRRGAPERGRASKLGIDRGLGTRTGARDRNTLGAVGAVARCQETAGGPWPSSVAHRAAASWRAIGAVGVQFAKTPAASIGATFGGSVANATHPVSAQWSLPCAAAWAGPAHGRTAPRML